MDVSEAFALLETDELRPEGQQLDTRELEVRSAQGAVRIAIDANGLRHVLVPTDDGDFRPDNASAGVTINPLVLKVGDLLVTFIDVACRDKALTLTFEHLAEDVLARLVTNPSHALRACRDTLNDWRTLLRSTRVHADRDTVLGLVGELEVLRALTTQAGPAAALGSWRGPRGAVHDFSHVDAELEVKSTAAVDPNFISVSNLDQLDPRSAASLVLAVVHCRESDAAPTLDDRVGELLALGMNKMELLRAVSNAGHLYEAGGDEHRFAVRGLRLWTVTDNFPGLRRSDMLESRMRGVSGVKYRLDLDVADPPFAQDKAAWKWVGSWLS